MATLNYFRDTQKLLNFGKSDFHKMLKTLGLDRKSPKYNDLHRLWLIASNVIAYELVAENKVKVRIFKVDTNISVMHHHPEKAIKVRNEVDKYIKELRSKEDEEPAEWPIRIKGYDDRKIQEIIHRADQPKLSDAQYEARKYRKPRKNFHIKDHKIKVQSFNLDLRDMKPNSVRQIIDTLYCLENICRDLRRFAGQLTEEVRSQEYPTPNPLEPSSIKYDTIEYYNFIKSRSLWEYADLQEINTYLAKSGKPILDETESRLPPQKKLKLIQQKLRLHDMELDHLRATIRMNADNAEDDNISDQAAPDLVKKRKSKDGKTGSKK